MYALERTQENLFSIQKMNKGCFFCKLSTDPQLDWNCRHCATTYHFVCDKQRNQTDQDGSVDAPYTCVHCNTVMNDTTVGYWAVGTYEVDRKHSVLDVAYIYRGVVVVVQPYWSENDNMTAFIGAQCPRKFDEYIGKNFDAIVNRLKEIKIWRGFL